MRACNLQDITGKMRKCASNRWLQIMGVIPARPAQRHQWPQRNQWDSLDAMGGFGTARDTTIKIVGLGTMALSGFGTR